MSLLFLEGFETHDGRDKRGWVGNNSGTDPNDGRFGTRSCERLANNFVLSRNFVNTDATVIVGWSMKVDTSGGAHDECFSLRADAGTAADALRLTINGSDKSFRLYYNNFTSLVGTTAPDIYSNDVHFSVQVKVFVHDTTGTVELLINGISVLSATGIDTHLGTNAYVDWVRWFGTDSAFWIDDVWICNGVDSGITGAPNDDYLGDPHVEAIFPSAEGALIEWTPSTGTDNSALIDENPIPNGDTDYNSDSTIGNIDRHDMDTIQADSGATIFGIEVSSFAKKTDAGARSFRHNILSDVTTDTKGDWALTTDYDYFFDIWEDDPDGGAAWTVAQLDAAEIGYETR